MILCWPSSIGSFTSLKELCTAASLKMTLDWFQKNAALPYRRWPYQMMPLYEMNDVTFLIWKQTSKAILKLVCWFNFQVLVVLYFLPLIQVAFWQGAKKKKKKTWENRPPKSTPGWYPSDVTAKPSRKATKKTKTINQANGCPWVIGTQG